MNTPTPSSSASEGHQPSGASPEAHTLSPVSPESAAKLEPLSAAAGEQAALPADPLQHAAAKPEAGRAGKGNSRKPFRWAVWLVGFLIFSVVAGILAMIYYAVGSISGTELDAVNWTTRDFQFVRDPFTETQLTSIVHTGGDFTLDPVIAAHINGGPARPALPRWDLVRIYRGMSSGTGEAHILLEYLEASDPQGQNVWIEWTRNHSKAAPILWGAVRDVVHLERYDRLPEIFDQVRIDDDPKALKAGLAKIMLELALEEARARVKAGDPAGAGRAALVGLSYGRSAELRSLAAGAPRSVASDAPDGAQEEAPRDAQNDAAADASDDNRQEN